MAQSSSPVLYPFSVIYYFFPKGLLFFSIFHLWIFLWGLYFLFEKTIRNKRWGWLIFLLFIPIGNLRPDWLAAISWLPFALWLLVRRPWFGRLLSGIFFTLIFLSLSFGPALFLSGLLIAGGLGVELRREKGKSRRIIKIGGFFLLMLFVGMGLAGPQLFPRLASQFGNLFFQNPFGQDTPGGSQNTRQGLAFGLGLYAALLSLAALFLGLIVLGWRRFYREEENTPTVRRIAKNSVTPLFAQLFGKGLDFGFAIFSLRLLGPEGNGRFTIATTTWLIFATFTDFGLETLVTREVAKDRSIENSRRLFSTMAITRLVLALLSLPVALIWVGGFGITGNMAGDTALAIGILMLGFFPGSLSGAMTAIFRGFEKYEYLAALQIFISIIRVPIALGALLAGWGVAGLAGSALVLNLITLIILSSIFKREFFQPAYFKSFDFKLSRELLGLSFPLLLNGLINNIFFKSDALILGAFRSNTEVGLYNSAYKFIDAVLIIPSAFTLALFPVLARYGSTSMIEMKRAFRDGLRVLLIIGLPISAGTMFVANDLIGVLGGAKYLPGGAICLQILIWFLPFSYINGLTQYVLISLNKQKQITLAIVAAAIINIVLNVIFIPFFGYIAPSAITIVSELVLLVPFTYLTQKELGNLSLFKLSWRPVLASGLMILGLTAITQGLGINNFFLTVFFGGIFYLVTLISFGTITPDDLGMLKKIFARKKTEEPAQS